MKKYLIFFISIMLCFSVGFGKPKDALEKSLLDNLLFAAFGQATSNYMAPGGARWVIRGELEIDSTGGYIDIESGGALKLAGTDITTYLGYLDVTPGTVTASKFVAVDSSKDISIFRYLSAVGLYAGASGTAGAVRVYPTTASKGYFALSCTDQTGDTAATITADAMGQATTLHWADPGGATSYLVQSTAALAMTEVDVLDGVTAGTVTASLAAVVDSNKDIGDFRNLDATNIDLGLSGTAGTLDIFPSTAASGYFRLACTDQTGDTKIEINANAHGQATTVNIADGGAAASYMVQSTAALTLAEADFLDGATAGTQVASKAVIADANVNTGVSKITELHIGATGAETQVTATAAELNYNDITAVGTAEASKALIVDGSIDISSINVLGAATGNFGTALNSTALVSVDFDDTTDGIVDVIDLSHTSSDDNATALDGIGISFELENATGTSTVEEHGSLDIQSTTITDGSEDSDFVFSQMLAGTVTESFRLDSSDQSLTIGRNATDANGMYQLRILPVTASKGSLRMQAVANTGDTDVTIKNAAHGQGTDVIIPDGGAATTYLVQSTAALTLTEADILDDATITTAELNLLDGVVKTTAELNEVYLTVQIPNVSAASSTWIVSPIAGNITKVYTVIDGAIATADDVVTLEIGGTLVTDSTITIANAGSAAGDVDSSTPSANYAITAGGAIEIVNSGASDNAVIAWVTIVITTT